MNKIRSLTFKFYENKNDEYQTVINSFYFELFDKIINEIRHEALTTNCDINTLKLTKV